MGWRPEGEAANQRDGGEARMSRRSGFGAWRAKAIEKIEEIYRRF
jgi:hypothetical protein